MFTGLGTLVRLAKNTFDFPVEQMHISTWLAGFEIAGKEASEDVLEISGIVAFELPVADANGVGGIARDWVRIE